MIYYEEEVKSYSFYVFIEDNDATIYDVIPVERNLNSAQYLISGLSCEPYVKVTIKTRLSEDDRENAESALRAFLENNDIDFVDIIA